MGQDPKLARRMTDIQPFYVMELLARARELERQGRSIIHMEIGEPDFVTPEPVVRAGKRALEEGRTHYTPAVGLLKLRQAIAGDYGARFGLDIDHSRVVVTPGASGALQLVLSTLIDPGTSVLMADPGYPCNRHFVRLLEGRPVSIAVGPETGYQLTAKQVQAAWRPDTRAVMLASPSNPTGTLLSRAELQRIHAVVRERGGFLIVDEIYQGLLYDGESYSALEMGSDVFVINSFSKYFGMTGWRLGWVVAPIEYQDALDRLAQNIFLAAPTLSQYAALAAFSPETAHILEQRRQAFKARRDFLLPRLRELGFGIPVEPQGAFYVYADCSGLTGDSFRFARDLLDVAGVAITPGLDFGNNRPEAHVRFAYTTGHAKLEEGVRRIRDWLGG